MHDALGHLATLRRPRILMRAARFAAETYRRDEALPRLLHLDTPPRTAEALMRLIGRGAELEAARQAGLATYAMQRHVDVLGAIVGEARLSRAARVAEDATPQTKASGIEAFLPST